MQNSWIQRSQGCVAPQARVGVSELNEEHLSRQGFFGPVAMVYHRDTPTEPTRVEGPLRIAGATVASIATDDAVDGAGLPVPLLYNSALTLSLSRRSEAMPFLLRNVDADTLYFVSDGTGDLATEFGALPYRPGDFLLIPKGITYRLMPSRATTAFVLESTEPIGLTEHRQVGRHAPFDAGVIGTPQLQDYDWPPQNEWEVRLKHGRTTTSWFYAELPFDVVGWKGDLFPLQLNVDDIRAITCERLHLAPSAWSVFEAASFMCVAFVPMSIVSDPAAEELPSRHRNIDTDEVLWIRKIGGMPVDHIEHLPQGLTHGPTSRGDYDATRKTGMTRLLEGISIDTFGRLERTPAFLAHVSDHAKEA